MKNDLTVEFNSVIDFNGKEIEVEVTAIITAYYPAKTYGPPEDCYPEEGGECDSLQVVNIETGEDISDKIDESEREDLINEAIEKSIDMEENSAYKYEDNDDDYWL